MTVHLPRGNLYPSSRGFPRRLCGTDLAGGGDLCSLNRIIKSFGYSHNSHVLIQSLCGRTISHRQSQCLCGLPACKTEWEGSEGVSVCV